MSHRALGQQFTKLFHGTTVSEAADIDKGGLHPNDLGMVYLTHNEGRAEMYAHRRASERPGEGPAVVEVHVPHQRQGRLSEGAREHEVVHWGHVPPKHVHSIWHLDPED